MEDHSDSRLGFRLHHLSKIKELNEDFETNEVMYKTDERRDNSAQKKYGPGNTIGDILEKFNEQEQSSPFYSIEMCCEKNITYNEGRFFESKRDEATFKLPYLFHGESSNRQKPSSEELKSFGNSKSLEPLPVLLVTPDDIRRDRKDQKVMERKESINQLEQVIEENANILQIEKFRRLKVQEEMCIQLRNNNELYNRDAFNFLKLCRFEENVENPGEIFDKSLENDKEILGASHVKNFIRRNIEFASRTVTTLPLTDEEKRHLDQMLSDIPSHNFENKSGDESKSELENGEGNTVEDDKEIFNAFQLSEDDKKRLSEIDVELENNYQETAHLRSANMVSAQNFWKNLVLEEMLNDIDIKLLTFQQEDNVINNKS